MSTGRGLACAVLALALTGCSSAPSTQRLADDALAALGGADAVRGVQSFVLQGGTGTRSRLGQLFKTGDADAPATLSNVVETVDLAGGRAVLDYEIGTAGGFSQHRQEILTKQGDRGVGLENVAGRPLAVVSPSGLFSWGTQNSPSVLLRRNVIAVALAAADNPSADPPESRELDGRTYSFGRATLGGETIGVYFDPESKLIAAFEATDTETMLGDVEALYRLEDYREVSGVRLPHKITIRKGGEHYSDVQFSSASVNDAGALGVFDIPEAAATDVATALAAGEDYSPVTLSTIGGGVHFAQAYSHHSLVVEFPTFLAVVEAPYTEAQSLTLARVLSERFPDKPIRYAAVTHPHFDHTGGVRGIAAQGATIVTAQEHAPQIQAILDAPHTNPADTLAARRGASQPVGAIETFEGRHVISEGKQSLELYAVNGFPHVEPMVLAFVPSTGVLFQSDIFFPGTGGGASPDAVRLLDATRELKLRVRTNAGGHGGVAPFQELVTAVARN